MRCCRDLSATSHATGRCGMPPRQSHPNARNAPGDPSMRALARRQLSASPQFPVSDVPSTHHGRPPAPPHQALQHQALQSRCLLSDRLQSAMATQGDQPPPRLRVVAGVAAGPHRAWGDRPAEHTAPLAATVLCTTFQRARKQFEPALLRGCLEIRGRAGSGRIP